MTEENNIKKAPFRFRNFFIEESRIQRKSFEIGVINIDIKPEGLIFNKKKIFKLILNVNLVSKNENFKAFVKIVGLFEFVDVINTELLDNYFYTNAPAILFPYVRSYISALTALSGIETINLPPLSLAALKEDLKRNVKIINKTEDN